VCGRYLTKDQRALERELSLNIRRWPKFEASYNVAPTQLAPVVIATQGYVCELMHFGMVPFFAHGERPKLSTINARVERIESSPAWRGPWQRGQRCLVLACGFYEWHVLPDGYTKQPYLIQLADQDSFAMAGLWDRSRADGVEVRSFTIITLPASPLMAKIHNAKKREPAIRARADCERWLSGPPEAARTALKPYPDELYVCYPVSKRVNSPKNNDAALIEQIAA
jgi:putative SOS response-associated peptidase YedK